MGYNVSAEKKLTVKIISAVIMLSGARINTSWEYHLEPITKMIGQMIYKMQ